MRDAMIVMARPDGRDERMTSSCALSLAYGSDENSFKLETSPREAPSEGWRVYVDGTPWGGIVDKVKASKGRDGSPRVVCSGRTWQGILAGRRLTPRAGSARLGAHGEAGEALASLVADLGLDGLFEVERSPDPVSYEFERFTDAYSGIREMLASSGLKLVLKSVQGRVLMRADKVEAIEVDGSRIGVEVERVHRCVNHLVCAGTGELEDRIVIDLYADAEGNVSETQSLFGVDEIEAYYDYNNADEAELRDSGAEKLKGVQSHGAVSVRFPDGIEAEVGDVLSGIDDALGVSAAAPVVKKVVKIERGIVSVSCEAGCENAVSTSNSTITGTAETSGAVSYVAGDGITISGGRISADVTRADLDAVGATADDARKTASDAQAAAGRAQQTADGKADAGHKHSASDVTSGVLPVARGGTGATSRVGVWNNVMMMELLDWETVDWNTLTDSGFARNTSLSGKNAPPCDYPYGMLEVARSNINPLAQYLIQRWTSDGMHGSYVRNGWKESDGSYSWSSWNKLTYEQDVAPKSHKHSKADVTDFPASMPASDVSAWAKAPTKPTYTAAEVGAAPKSHRHAWGEVAGKPTTYPPEAHTHPYAGSASAGGAATSAVKLATARKITLAGAVNGSAAFDGSADVTITVEGDSAAAGFLAAHPVGFYVECKAGVDPNSVGGTWEQAPSVGPCVWLRIK